MTEEVKKPTKQDLIEMLDEMNLNIEKMPAYALVSPISHYDFSALLILLSALFKSEATSAALDCKNDTASID